MFNKSKTDTNFLLSNRILKSLGIMIIPLVLMKTTAAVDDESDDLACQSSPTVATSLSFTSTPLTSIAPFLPLRLRSPGWAQVDTVIKCALRTTQEYPKARGCLYNESTALCTPVLYLVSPYHDEARDVEPAEGTLYLASDVCTDGFQIYAFGSKLEPICLQDMPEITNFSNASQICASHGGFLASVKTGEKLEFFKNITGGYDRWVGLDDIDNEGVFIWHSDGSALTSEQTNALFVPGEPNNQHGNEDCIQFWRVRQKLNDKSCTFQYRFVCEIPLPTSTC